MSFNEWYQSEYKEGKFDASFYDGVTAGIESVEIIEYKEFCNRNKITPVWDI